MSAQDIVGALLNLASINRRVNTNAVASLTWITYDIITCFDQEVELIWKTRWTVPKVLYIALRYYAPLWLMYQTIIHITPGTQLSKLTCETFPPLQAVGPVILWILVDIIMMLRIRALYRDKKSIVFAVLFIWFAAASVVIPVTIFCFRLSRPIPAPPFIANIAGCVVLSIDWDKMKVAKAAVISFILLNMVYLGLTLHKFIESVRSMKRIEWGSIYTIFIGEGVAYFIGCIIINAVDIAFSSGSPSLFPYVDLAQFWLSAYYSYAGCHLILHLRSVNSQLSALQSFGDCADLGIRFTPGTMKSWSSGESEELPHSVSSYDTRSKASTWN
ncbi:unnamed protein product [Cyclocybe aegerita]|uniref:DUF6533 domain-containing protein n=1 Tax=Cyclocybe aegerita TaxID=1973307 RepID=A0A8S0W2J2_CYCAE|nr:unnamed protein product [Cyclocybe aegerita]